MFTKDKIYFNKIWMYLIWITSSVAQEITPLQHPSIIPIDPKWTDNLPKATFTLPKSSEYREITPGAEITVEHQPTPIEPAIKLSTETNPPVKLEPVRENPSQPEIIINSEPLPTPKPIENNPALQMDQNSSSNINPLPLNKIGEIHPKINSDSVQIKKKSTARIERKSLIFWRVQLAEGRDLEQLREYRQSFSDQYGNLVQNAESIISLDETKQLFRLQLKPLLNQNTAQHWCSILKDHGHEQCRIIKITQLSSPIWQIQIIAKRDLNELQEYQKNFINQYINLLKGYKLAITLSESGEYFRLRVKSIPTESIANQICITIKNQGADCFVTKKADLYAF